MNKFLRSSEIINWDHPKVSAKAKELAGKSKDQSEITKNCFEYVRDQIKHSLDYELNPVTLKASDVLEHKTGYCYAKSHLLAALLRANRIHTGLCYQRLTIDNDQLPFCIHGLNAVYLRRFGWYRLDARGNKPGIQAEFSPPIEQLAFPIISEGESDLPGILDEPIPEVVQVLKESTDFQKVSDNLPQMDSDLKQWVHGLLSALDSQRG